MNYSSYEQYLQSDEWKTKARKRAEIDGYKCCMCNSSGTMNRVTDNTGTRGWKDSLTLSNHVLAIESEV